MWIISFSVRRSKGWLGDVLRPIAKYFSHLKAAICNFSRHNSLFILVHDRKYLSTSIQKMLKPWISIYKCRLCMKQFFGFVIHYFQEQHHSNWCILPRFELWKDGASKSLRHLFDILQVFSNLLKLKLKQEMWNVFRSYIHLFSLAFNIFFSL